MLLFFSWIMVSASVQGVVLSEFSESFCENEVCGMKVYSYPRFYRNSFGNLEFLNESFDTINCNPGFGLCVDQNHFQFHAKQQFESFRITRGSAQIEFTPNTLVTALPHSFLSSSALVSDNTLTYTDVIPGILDVRYGYTWAGVKEEFILKQNVFTVLPLTSEVIVNFTIASNLNTVVENEIMRFTSVEGTEFTVKDLVAKDNLGRQASLSFLYQDGNFQLHVPVSFLHNASYPVSIDPTITLTSTNVTNDGFVHFDGFSNKYTRFAGGANTSLYVGDATGMLDGTQEYRSVIEWNIASIPKHADLSTVDLAVYAEVVADVENQNVSVRSMDGNWTTYQNTNAGNHDYFTDMKNGTLLANKITNTIGTHHFNLGTFDDGLDLESRRLTQEWWGLGLHTNPANPGTTAQLFSAAGNLNASRRPVLTISYRYANGVLGDAAIHQGILNSLPLASIFNETQVYTRNTTGTQQLGRFDRIAISGNKRWAFNYITTGESFTNMLNLSTTLFVFEMVNLSAGEITDQVSRYINATKNL